MAGSRSETARAKPSAPRTPPRLPARRDRAEHEACLPLRELHAQALLPMFPPHVNLVQLYMEDGQLYRTRTGYPDTSTAVLEYEI